MTTRPARVRRRLLAVVCLASCLVAPLAHGQAVGGTFLGRVRDASGGALPFASVSISNVATGVVTGVVTNADGFYSAPNLLPGSYEVTAAFDGFNSQTKSGITLTVGAEFPIDFTMTVGTVSESVDVSVAAASVDTVLGDPPAQRQRHDDPRTAPERAQLDAAGAPAAGRRRRRQQWRDALGERHEDGRGRRPAVREQLSAERDRRRTTTPTPPLATPSGPTSASRRWPSSRCSTNSYSAEYGRTSGGVVNAITRSGTNQIRGTAFEFHRNSGMDARDYFDRGDAPPPFHRNQFGVAFGGPWCATGRSGSVSTRACERRSARRPSRRCRPRRRAPAASPAARCAVDPQIARALALYPLPNGAAAGQRRHRPVTFAVRNKESARRLRAPQDRSQAVHRRQLQRHAPLRRRGHRAAGRPPEQADRRQLAADAHRVASTATPSGRRWSA